MKNIEELEEELKELRKYVEQLELHISILETLAEYSKMSDVYEKLVKQEKEKGCYEKL